MIKLILQGMSRRHMLMLSKVGAVQKRPPSHGRGVEGR